MSYTYVILELSHAAYTEIAAKMRNAGYEHAFCPGDGEGDERIDMHGIAVAPETIVIVKSQPEGKGG